MKLRVLCGLLLFSCASVAAQNKGRVVEEIIARVNNDIITTTDLQRARASLQDEVEQDCRGCPPAQIQARLAEKEKNLLRDLIDQSLLVQRAKDVGLNVETDVIKQLDQIRQQNSIASMEELEKRVNESGTSFEDFKDTIRRRLLTQEVIRRDVGSHLILSHEEVQKYYEEHKKEFQRPEQVHLQEIFVSTAGKKPEEIPELEKKAKNLLERVKNGEDFGELAKRYSDGTTAKSGGDLGVFERRQLAKDLEEIVFKMNRGQLTDVIPTKTGFLVLRVVQHFEAGQQPLDKVEGEISNAIYMQKIEPALREYLKQLREDSYVFVHPGYTDTAGVSSSPIDEVAAAPAPTTEKKKRRRFLIF